MTFQQQLMEMSACNEAVEWVGRKPLKTAWAKCERGDWMLWLAGRLHIDRKLLILAACDCAETVLKYVPEGDQRPAKAIEVARAWVEGKASTRDVDEARRDAAAAAAAHAAAHAAAAAAHAAAADADAAAAAAAHAAQGSRKTHTKLIRKRIPFEIINAAMKREIL